MDIKEYISSGIIESYVLGLASAEERAEFEKLCDQYPELKASRNEFEIALENRLLSEAVMVMPAATVKENLMNLIRQDIPAGQSKVITMQTDTTHKSGWTRYVAAASVIILLVSAYFVYNFYTKNKKLEGSNKDLQAQMDKMVEDQKVINDPNVVVVNLVGTTPSKASASIYWDSTSTNVFLVVKNMPQLPTDKQYQLWALIDGKPKDLGLFDVKKDEKRLILKMNNTQKADAFAITIEDRGNTGGPTLKQLQTMGKTSL